jgi:hypothetical protein
VNVAAVDKPVPTRALPHRWVAPLAALALLAGGGALIQAGGTVLRNLGMVAVPQRYVALSLPDPTALPAQVQPGAPIAFDFAISNSTTAVLRQRWIADVSGTGLADQEIAHGSVTVSPGASVTIPVHFEMPDTSSAVTTRISAPGQNLAPLEFHVVPASGGGTR